MSRRAAAESVRIPAGGALLDGDLIVPQDLSGLVVFAHGGGLKMRLAADWFRTHLGGERAQKRAG